MHENLCNASIVSSGCHLGPLLTFMRMSLFILLDFAIQDRLQLCSSGLAESLSF